MYTSKFRILAYVQLVIAYRAMRCFVWCPTTGYAFPCSSQGAVLDLLAFAPHFERLTW